MQHITSREAALVLFERHRKTLDQAVEALENRGFWTPYPENPKHYSDQDMEKALARFQQQLHKPFLLKGPEPVGQISCEFSPYGFPLGISYDRYDHDKLLDRMQQAMPAWRAAGPEARLGVCMEVIQRLNAMSADMSWAVMHTTGQAHMMAFQAGGPHAQDRGLEALAYAWRHMKSVPSRVNWVKPQGKRAPLQLEKHWFAVPRGISLLIGCATFPTWNTYPGLFASLATGNPVVIKPHPNAILPLAMTVRICQEVLLELGFDPLLVNLLADTPDAPVAQKVAVDQRVKLIDFTGSSAFGNWLEENARQAQVFTEKAGVNTILLESVRDLDAVARNLAFTLSLYSGQMCTTPQIIFIPETGIRCGDETISFERCADALRQAIEALLSDNGRACAILGAIQSEATIERIDQCRGTGRVLLDSETRIHPDFPMARVRTPLLLQMKGTSSALYSEEQFGPISFVVATKSHTDSVRLVSEIVKEKGALTLTLYSTDADTIARGETLAQELAVSISINFDGAIFPNQSAAFSDFHGSGANPAANAAIVDDSFVSRRFAWVQSRITVEG